MLVIYSQVDESLVRILTPMARLGVLDRPASGDLDNNVTSPEHSALARSLAANATVLLKNSAGVLPLERAASGAPLSIVVIGKAAHTDPIVHGGGSGQVTQPHGLPSKGTTSG